MRIVITAALLSFALPVHGQSPADHALPTQAPATRKAPVKTPGAPPPAGAQLPTLQPVPEPPPPPPGFEPDPALEPQITIQRRGTDTVEEFRLNGRLYMIKVTPAHGVPYYLIDDVGRGQFVRRDSYDTGTRVPMWVIHQF